MYWVTIYPLDQIKSAMATDSIIVSERKYPTMTVTAQVYLTCCWTRCGLRAQRCAADVLLLGRCELGASSEDVDCHDRGAMVYENNL